MLFVTYLEGSVICPLPHTRALRKPRLTSVAVIDRQERVIQFLPPGEHSQFPWLAATDDIGTVGIQTATYFY